MNARRYVVSDRRVAGLDARLRLDGTDAMPALRLIRPPASARLIASLLALSVPFTLLFLLLVPWQQTASSTGRVVAWAPGDRQQTVDAPIQGRLKAFLVAEGDTVRAGQPLVELEDNDPDYMARLVDQREAALAARSAATQQISSYEAKLLAAEAARGLVLAEYDAKISAIERERVGELAALEAARIQDGRIRALNDEGIASGRDRELAAASLAKSQAVVEKLDRERDAWIQAKGKAAQDADAKIAEARADLAAARAKEAEATQKVTSFETTIARQASQVLTAPRDGWVVRLAGGEGGGQVKKGDELVTIVPETDSRAVELFVDGNDLPLVSRGDEVRLVFEGWPALQMVGLPGMHRGTFAGEVAFVSPVDDGKGKFRVLAVPSEAEPWPSPEVLRQGVRAKGWVAVGRVPLGWELWRRLNGFPLQPDVARGDKPALPSAKKPRTPPELR